MVAAKRSSGQKEFRKTKHRVDVERRTANKLVRDSIVKGNRSVVISQFSQREYAILESGKRPQQPFSLYLAFQLYEA